MFKSGLHGCLQLLFLLDKRCIRSHSRLPSAHTTPLTPGVILFSHGRRRGVGVGWFCVVFWCIRYRAGAALRLPCHCACRQIYIASSPAAALALSVRLSFLPARGFWFRHSLQWFKLVCSVLHSSAAVLTLCVLKTRYYLYAERMPYTFSVLLPILR